MVEAGASTLLVEYTIRKDLTRELLERDLAEAWAEATHSDKGLAAQMKGAGLATASAPFELSVRQGGDLASATLLVLLAAAAIRVGEKAAKDIWVKIVLPWLEAKYGKGTFKKK